MDMIARTVVCNYSYVMVCPGGGGMAMFRIVIAGVLKNMN